MMTRKSERAGDRCYARGPIWNTIFVVAGYALLIVGLGVARDIGTAPREDIVWILAAAGFGVAVGRLVSSGANGIAVTLASGAMRLSARSVDLDAVGVARWRAWCSSVIRFVLVPGCLSLGWVMSHPLAIGFFPGAAFTLAVLLSDGNVWSEEQEAGRSPSMARESKVER